MKIFGNKIYNVVRTALYIALAVVIIVLAKPFVKELKYTVGAVMIFYGVEETTHIFFTHQKRYKISSLYWNAIEMVVGIVLMSAVHQSDELMLYAVVCTAWAVWSILRETRELVEATVDFKQMTAPGKAVLLLDFVESITVIVFSLTMIASPTKSHALVHVYLLAAEKITKVLFPMAHVFKKKEPEQADEAAKKEPCP